MRVKSFLYLGKHWLKIKKSKILWTAQLYGILRHQTEPDRFWEYGFYAGDTDKVKDYLSTKKQDKSRMKTKVKVRVSWEFRNFSRQSALMLTTSWNIDDFK